MKWTEIKVKTTTEAVEAVANIFYEIGAQGVVIEDPNDFLYQQKDELSWDYIEEEVFFNGYEGAIVKAYLSEEENVLAKIESIKESVNNLPSFGINIGDGIVELEEVNQQDWENAWKQYYKPVKVSDKIVIKPTWEEYNAKLNELVIELDPGMAFGTGTHETTNMCIQALERHIDSNCSVLDIGCGSGILSIAAAKLGADRVLGVDLDPVAVKVSKENIEQNNLLGFVEIRHGNLMDVVTEKTDIVVANIIADIVIKLADEVANYMKEDGLFISSGIIMPRLEEVKKAIEDKGFEILEVNTQGEWACITAKTL
ncbi:50S ribosomal protein L11 methyltransferase [Acetoanaerobium noterae]|uniref:50S ribosomal protein L11 methyltransferase n=1 Tax=Acetoanaerobium noterae TaxID=745369 RepID=UPI003341A404